ncbi:MAG TPA: hypothetical protein DCS07_15170 [Bdellovibrionales bacterium]|nr:MAG: hypothetical protein A2Z97_10780 [Bdellovibrionales bacterium GWB1_52_6]OFZ03378.1 MAG: hypothetical protein A2X97_05385 [Bdellovibrionales bacterium GWA1_52_35]HAR43952.1 hypothetical protein [Bdellovibrionales bacterium]HCM40961.1 hypothetical protein [Bdellovibrionales bacterium]
MVYPNLDSKSSAKFVLPVGAVTELAGPLGSGKTEWLLRYLAGKPKLRVAWLEPGSGSGYSSFPTAFPEYGVSLERVLFVDCGRQLLWAAHQILKSQTYEVIVLRGDIGNQSLLDEMDFRRLQLLAEKSQLSVILLNEKPTQKGAWPIATQLEVARPAVTPDLLDFEVERGKPGFQVIKQRPRSIDGAGVGGSAAIPTWGQKAWQKLGLLPTG